MELWKLPEGWAWKKMSEISIINPRRPRIQRNDDDPTSFVPMQAVDELEGKIFQMQIRPYVKVKSGYTFFEENDVLFAKITPSMENGKAAIARGLINGIGFGSTEFHVFHPNPDILPEWIFYYIRRKSFREEAKENFRGAVGQQRVPEDFLTEYPIPLPYPDDPQRSLAEQRRIVARLEMMLGEVREMRAIIREMRKDVDRLMEAALEEVFPEYGQKLPGGWEWRPVKYVATETTRRNPRANVQSSQRLLTSPSENMLEQKRDGADIGFRYVEISSVDNRNCRIVLEKVKYILNKDAPGRARQVIHENDVIFATTRPYLKNIALIPNELNGEICSTGFCVLCPIPERIVPKFLFYAVRANSFVKQLLSRQKGATYPAITDEDVFANQIPLPYPNEPNRSKAVQHHIVAYLEAVEDEILSVQKLLDQDEQAVNQLEQSILEAAFRGEI